VSVIEGEARVAVKEALPALGMLTAFVFAWGMMQLLDRFCRALFGTAEGLVGWIPFGGKVVRHSIHKIEQKVSNYIGGAERGIDTHIAASYHKLAAVVRGIPSQLVDQAGLIFGLAAALVVLPTRALVHKLIESRFSPDRRLHADEAQMKALHKSVAQGVYPRLRAGEVYDRTVAQPNVRTARAEARAAEEQAIATYKWMVKHRTSLLTGAFTGAAAWALTRLGGGWIRCKNWRTIGKHVCRWPYSLIEALLGLGLAFAVVIDPRKTAEAAVAVEDVMESIIRKIAD
jgi:hypothetical protein